MARTMSIGRFKNGQGGYRRPVPAEGTRLRELYDLFKANEGVPVAVATSRGRPVDDLTDFYGLDIMCLIPGRGGAPPHNVKPVYVLAGEWFGMEYVDYIARHLERAPSIVPE